LEKARVKMKSKCKTVSALACISSFAITCFGQEIIWQKLNYGIAEFGITSVVGGIPAQSPAVFESGYNGAYGFGASPGWGFAQSFSVPSDRSLASIQLRLGGGNPQGAGQFLLSLLEFDPQTQTPGPLLGSVTDVGANYRYDLLAVPISSWDFSGFNILLRATNTYVWTLTPASPSWSGSVSIQAAVASLYPGGFAYALNPIPEPATPWLLALGLLALAAFRKRSVPAWR